MDIINSRGEKIGSRTTAISNDKSITIQQVYKTTMVSTLDRNTGKATTEIFHGDSPYGK